MNQFLIWSHEHRGWWRAGRNGYTQDIRNAGRYSAVEAAEIVKSANTALGSTTDFPEETMCEVPEVLQ